MNIGINARLFIKGKMEGVATYIHENVRRMIDNHPEDNFILFFDRAIDFEHLCSKPNVKAIKVSPPTRHPLLWELWWQWQIPRYLKKHSIDVFYSGEIFMPRKTNVPRVIVSHDLAYLHYPEQIPSSVLKYYRRTYPLNHKQADAIIAVSEATKRDIIKQYGLLDEDIHVVYNATTSGFKPIGLNAKKEIQAKHTNGLPFLAYLGSFHPRKNIVNLVKGFEVFKKKSKLPHKLVLMGRWSWKTEEIKQTITNSEFKDDIVIIEDVGDDKHDIVAASEALCYVSVFEGFGIPVLEGFSAGVPVITSNVSSMPEVAGDAALLVNPHDPSAIGDAMSSAVKDEPLREKLIQKGFSRVKDFDWETSAKQTYEVLRSVVK